ncbi:MAG TPA: protein kinase [Terriglobia bacterium]|nr:protein kinase [Terriglobia bacterium]
MDEVKTGTKFGPYEILSQIGEGGMGSVYRATDSRLGRDVAIKFSAEKFSERFERESRAIAALNHPNICTLHDVGASYLVMELVEGKTLEERIKEGALSLEESLDIARQIASALEAAHEKGIVHRDLKPANIKITPNGMVKVLDFGLARTAESSSAIVTEAKTVVGGTMAGTILGTAGYMAPEQARGLTADKRADIWAFGVVLYEMLTGDGAFLGDTTPDMLAAVLTREPDWKRVPARAQTLLRRCLEKDPQRRLRDIGDALPLVDLTPQAEVTPISSKRSWLWPVATAVALLVALSVALVHFGESVPVSDPIRFSITLPERVSLVYPGSFAISPDGRKLVFGAIGSDGARRLWVRTLDSLEARPLQDAVILNPTLLFWSADSRSIAYQGDGNNLMRIDLVAGGQPTRVAALPSGGVGGGSWSASDVILFGTVQGVMQVPAAGGTPTLVTKSEPGSSEVHWNPRFLPDGKRFLYVRIVPNAPEKLGMSLGSIELTPEQQSAERLGGGLAAPEYVPPTGSRPGLLLYLRDTAVLARTFNVDTFELSGEPVIVAEPVGFNNPRGQAFYSVSRDGVLVFRGNPNPNAQFTWYNRNGDQSGRGGDPGRFGTIALAPDGVRVATSVPDSQTGRPDIWVFDLETGASNRLTFHPGIDQQPLWSRDGNRITFASSREDGWGLYQKSANGAGNDELLLKAEQATNVTDWSKDGRFMIYHTARIPRDLWILPLTGDRKPIPFLQTPADEFGARFSPDGKWILYGSNESGSNEIYVQPFNANGASGGASITGKWMVSKGAVGMPRWRGDGKEIFYMATDGNIMAAEVIPDVAFRVGPAKPLFQVPPVFLRAYTNPGASADVAPDGKRFLFAMPVSEGTGDQFNVAMGWAAAWND